MEKIAIPFNAPEGALPGQFCRSHIATQENPSGTDCSAHLAEARVFECPFSSPDEAGNGVIMEDGSRGRVCADFILRDYGPDSDWSLRIR